MNTPRKPLWTKIVATVVVLVVLYVASIGPVSRIHDTLPVQFQDAARVVYWPILEASVYSPTVLRTLIWYYGLWAANEAP